MSDPISVLRRRRHLTFALCAALLTATTLWWRAPITRYQRSTSPSIASVAGNAEKPIEHSGLNHAAFDAMLWNPPPPTPPTQPEQHYPAAALPRPDLQLIGIVEEDGLLRAALYDPATDTLHTAGRGDHVGTIRIERVHAGAVEIRLDGRAFHLLLDDRNQP